MDHNSRSRELEKPRWKQEAEKAQIGIHGADDLYREIRVENVVADEKGQQTKLREGEEVDVIIEADSDGNLKKPRPR